MIKNNYIKYITRRLLIIFILLILIFASIVPIVHAETAKEKKARLEKEIKAAKKDRDYIKSEMTKNIEMINELQAQIEEKELEIKQLDQEIETIQKEVEDIAADLKDQEEDYAKQEVLVKKRLTFMYESGQYTSWEILLKSNNLMDFLANYYMLQELSKLDNEILSESSRNKRKIEVLKKELDSKKKVLTEAQTRVKKSKLSQENIVKSKEQTVAKLNKKEKDVLNKIENLEALEREARRQIALEAARYQGHQIYIDGGFAWPTPTSWVVTTPFGRVGPPIYPWSSFHGGIDIGSTVGGDPIVAAKEGTVVAVTKHVTGYVPGSYGNYVKIWHGNSEYTFYAHGKYGTVNVSVGDKVKQGETIMIMGSTGESRGPHLHFEIEIGGRLVDPLNYYNFSQIRHSYY